MKTIRRGDRGKEVKTAQQLLNHKGYGAGSVDGIFGENTEKAVRALQKTMASRWTASLERTLGIRWRWMVY